MTTEQYKLKDKSNTELREWIAQQEPDTTEYIAGIEESMRRVAVIEEIIEKKEAPICRRECVAAIIAILFIAATILTIILSYE